VDEQHLTFAFDFVDPGSYLVRELLVRWLDAASLHRIRMLPLELRVPGSSPLSPRSEAWRRLTEEMARVAAELDVAFSPPDMVPWTRKAHELAFHALEVEDQASIYDLLFRAYFRDALDLGRVDVLIRLADRAGLDASEVRTVLGVDRFDARVHEARQEALASGIRGVPTLVRGPHRLEGFTQEADLHRFLLDSGMLETID